MNFDFDLENIAATELAVGRYIREDQVYSAVPSNNEVQSALEYMLNATIDQMNEISEEPQLYAPSEKYSGTEHLYIPLDNEMAELFSVVHRAANLDIDKRALEDIDSVFCYLAKFTDNSDRQLTALHRSAQFKSLGKRPILQLLDDTLTVTKNPLFKLDADFDLLVDSNRVHIFRPRSFELLGKLQESILEAVPRNVQALSSSLPFVKFDSIEEYASHHPRAAGYLASIRSQGWAEDIDKSALTKLCEATAVGIEESDGQLSIPGDQVMGFLEVLDRRRFEVELVLNSPERFRAASRQKLGD